MFIVREKLSIDATTGGASVGQKTIARFRDSIILMSFNSVILNNKESFELINDNVQNRN